MSVRRTKSRTLKYVLSVMGYTIRPVTSDSMGCSATSRLVEDRIYTVSRPS